MEDTVGSRLAILLVPAVFALAALYFIPLRYWITVRSAGAPILLTDLIGMRLRNVPLAEIVGPMIVAHKAGIGVTVSQVEAHSLAGGRPREVVYALISADREGTELTFEQAALADLAGGGRGRRDED